MQKPLLTIIGDIDDKMLHLGFITIFNKEEMIEFLETVLKSLKENRETELNIKKANLN